MAAIITKNFAYCQAKRFIDSLSVTPLYVGIGKSTVWTDEEIPDIPSFTSFTTDFSDLIAIKRVTSSNLKHIVPRIDWVATTVYSTGSYVVTSSYQVYYCVASSGQQSVTMPTSTNKSTTQVLDTTYTWQYLYTIVGQDVIDFMVSGWMPVYGWNGTDTNNALLSYDPAQTLGSNRVMMSILINGTESSTFPAGSGAEFRKIFLIQSPILSDNTTIATATSYAVASLKSGSGLILYKDYRKKIIREATQKDNINIILEL